MQLAEAVQLPEAVQLAEAVQSPEAVQLAVAVQLAEAVQSPQAVQLYLSSWFKEQRMKQQQAPEVAVPETEVSQQRPEGLREAAGVP